MRDLRKNIIVSVDDFGIRSVADTILPLAQQGKIDRVSVLINYVSSKEQALALVATGVKIDLHLELIQLVRSGENVTESTLFRGVNFMIRYILGFVSAREVTQAWMHQIERFKELFGQYPDGLNSHEHLHYFPQFFQVALTLGERYDIPFIRFARQGIVKQRGAIVSQILALLWKRDDVYYSAQKTRRDTADFFVSYDWIDNFDDFLKRLPVGKIEIVFHPERKSEYEAIEKYF